MSACSREAQVEHEIKPVCTFCFKLLVDIFWFSNKYTYVGHLTCWINGLIKCQSYNCYQM